MPEAAPLTDVGTEASWRLPFESVGQFAPMFRALESRGTEMGVVEFGISVTTLEEVFVKIRGVNDLEQVS